MYHVWPGAVFYTQHQPWPGFTRIYHTHRVTPPSARAELLAITSRVTNSEISVHPNTGVAQVVWVSSILRFLDPATRASTPYERRARHASRRHAL